uniref:Succinate dehydrogenase subunit 3 n=1 Tax=Glaucocystis nostochinearum TaxID=38271 RepID=E9P6E7_9EUKA|nr:succinate dehydrogenase subunit 3 [Glaucocystis nostochinearum]ADW83131.1 succinate dehydrogenase subunit 3 [Glaucocystis nostochinearum]
MTFNRPISPHLSIYKIQINSLLSITNRISSLVLSSIIFSIWYNHILYNIFYTNNLYYLLIKNIFITLLYNDIFIKSFIFFIFLNFYYHIFSGIRHLYWDIGQGLKINKIILNGLFVLLIIFSWTLLEYFLFHGEYQNTYGYF